VSAKQKLSPPRLRGRFFSCLVFALLRACIPFSARADSLEGMARSLDYQTRANVLVQKQAEPASALLRPWLSGYAFLFTMATNIERARGIRAVLPANMAAGTEPSRLRVDVPGEFAKPLGERVAVNARQAAILSASARRIATGCQRDGGEGHLAEVWLDVPETGPTPPGHSNGAATPATQPPVVSPGAKP
jgi:hypothetical protein